MTKYAITGVTGKFGQTAIKTLSQLRSSDEIVALARNTDKAKNLVPDGIEVRKGDYTDVASLTESLKGVDKLLFISSQPGGQVTREQQHLNVVKAAENAGIKFIAYTSFPHANTSTTPLAADHKATEVAIEKTGIKHSFLRNNWYLENEIASIKGALAGNSFVYSAADGHAGWALEREYAEAAAKVLVLDSPKDIYEFAGPSNTYADLAENVAQVSDHKFDVLSVSDADYTAGLESSGLDAGTAALVTSFQTLIRDGNLDENTDDLVTVLGHDLVTLPDAIKEIK